MRREADLAQKKRIITRSKSTLATKDKGLYPARSNRSHNDVEDTSKKILPQRFLHNSTSATDQKKKNNVIASRKHQIMDELQRSTRLYWRSHWKLRNRKERKEYQSQRRELDEQKCDDECEIRPLMIIIGWSLSDFSEN